MDQTLQLRISLWADEDEGETFDDEEGSDIE
jgi:hypothetical protein